MNERELRSFREGEHQYFDHVVRAHSGRLLQYARSFTPDPATAEDLVQEAWLKAYRARASFRGDGSLLGWLLAITRGVALDHLRKARPETHRSEESQPGTKMSTTFHDPLEGAEEAERVRHALAGLPSRQRDTVVLRVIEDRTVKETAALMNCAEGTVKAALHRALANLRELLNTTTGAVNDG